MCRVWYFQSPRLIIRLECGGHKKVEIKKLNLQTNQKPCNYQVTLPLDPKILILIILILIRVIHR